MIIDIHTHAFPTELAERAVTSLASLNDITPYTDGTLDGLRASMLKAGVDRSVIAPIATKPSQVKTINQWAVMVNKQYDNLTCFGTLHPFQDDWNEDIEQLVRDGIKGIKLHPDYQDFFADDARVMPLYRLLADAGLILLIHSGVDCGLPPPVHCPPENLARVLDAVPDLKIIAAHMGGFEMWEDVHRHLAGRNLYIDTSYSLPYMGAEAMVALIKAHGPDRVLFGTDSPWGGQSEDIASIRALPLTSEEIEAILGANAARLLA